MPAITPPSRWTVRARTTVASTIVVMLCLAVAGGALLFVLYRTLETSARATAESRAAQLADQLITEPSSDLDRAMLATDSQVGFVQVVDQFGHLTAQSAGSPSIAVSQIGVPPATDFWVTAVGADTPTGPVTILVGADREPVENVITTVAGLLGIGGPLIVALVAFGTYRLVGSALQPVERIRSQVSLLTSGTLAERIPVPVADDEIARLATTMNDMLDRLQAGQAAQRSFVSDASHELRSPLATIIAALELAHGRPELLTHGLIENSLLPEAHRMRELVADLLLLARSDEGARGRPHLDVDLDDIVYAEADRVRAITHLHVSSTINPVRVTGDPKALSRLVRNLVDNAIRHSHNSIHLECVGADTFAEITVSDDGPGVPPAERTRVFDRFVRLDSPRAREAGGAGLGLSIVAQIANAHHGAVTLDQSQSGGARFVVRIAKGVDHSVTEPADGLDTLTGKR